MRRSNQEIRKSIFDAVSKIVKEHGFSKLSIPLISEESGVQPNVISRRFNNLDDIIEQYVERFDFWLTYFPEDRKSPNTRVAFQNSLEDILDIAWKKREIQRLLSWELADRSSLTMAVTQRREEALDNLLSNYDKFFNGSSIDLRAVSSILISSIYYLSGFQDKSTFCGVNMKGPEGNLIVSDTLKKIVNWAFDDLEKVKEKEMARKLLNKGYPIEDIMEITGLYENEIERE